VNGNNHIALTVAAFLGSVLTLCAAGAAKEPPKPGPLGDPLAGADAVPHERVEQAIGKGVAWLWSQRGGGPVKHAGLRDADKRLTWGFPPDKPGKPGEKNRVGITALVIYTLLASGESIRDRRIVQSLDWLIKNDEPSTYAISCRAMALHEACRHEPAKYRRALARDVRTLLESTRDGSYNYWPRGGARKGGSLSNDNFAVLGVWAGADAGIEVPSRYWRIVRDHWRRVQMPCGAWNYQRKRDLGPGHQHVQVGLTAAGVATLFICQDYLDAARAIRCRPLKPDPGIQAGLGWTAKNVNRILVSPKKKFYVWHRQFNYHLYSLERAALASGYKYFGAVDWYKMGVESALDLQNADGSFSMPGERIGKADPKMRGVTTCFTLLFLSRGRHPVLLNKLQYDGDWNNRPRALANLTRWLSKTFERPVHWQIVTLKSPVRHWHDAPILVISGSRAPTFSTDDLAKLRRYVQQGGTILSITECRGAGFSKGIRDVYARLLPGCTVRPCRPDHVIHTDKVYFRLGGKPVFHVVSNGARPLAIHTDDDLALHWQLGRYATAPTSFQAGANAVRYAAGTFAALRPRGTTHWPAAGPVKTTRTVRLARLKHAGTCDPEPLACERLRLMVARETGVKLEVVGPVEIGKLGDSGAALAMLTGTGDLSVSASDRAALKAFVAAGGTLAIDAAGGDRAFGQAAGAMLEAMYGRRGVRPLAKSSPLLLRRGFELKRAHYRAQTLARLGGGANYFALRGVVDEDGRLGVIFSREDLTCGLVGAESLAIQGYTSRCAYGIMRNIILMVAK